MQLSWQTHGKTSAAFPSLRTVGNRWLRISRDGCPSRDQDRNTTTWERKPVGKGSPIRERERIVEDPEAIAHSSLPKPSFSQRSFEILAKPEVAFQSWGGGCEVTKIVGRNPSATTWLQQLCWQDLIWVDQTSQSDCKHCAEACWKLHWELVQKAPCCVQDWNFIKPCQKMEPFIVWLWIGEARALAWNENSSCLWLIIWGGYDWVCLNSTFSE